MHHFIHRKSACDSSKHMNCEDVRISHIADSTETPFYCYSTATLKRHFEVFSSAFKDIDSLVCYSAKASPNINILKLLGKLGAGMDIVSYGELIRSQKAGIDPKKIVFSGVGKTELEMQKALEAGILCFNVESNEELATLNNVAKSMGVKAPVSLRINPDVDAKTHEKITTGRLDNKFGIEWHNAHHSYNQASQLDYIDIIGIDMHIGSQLSSLSPFVDAFSRLKELVHTLRSDGHNISHIDVGGGLGVPYKMHNNSDYNMPSPEEYGKVIKDKVANLGCKIIFEPGRVISANSAVLVTKVLYVKKSDAKTFVIVDSGMNDLMRPSLYNAHHDIISVKDDGCEDTITCDVVGPVCESGDVFGKNIELPSTIQAGDLLAIMSAGAYGASISNNYNSRPLLAEILVDCDSFKTIRKRQTYEQMLQCEM
jgi:diaminopimelate decarboxylase